MNPRIQELIDQSYDEVPHERDWDAVTRIFNQEKFAKLLILECADIATNRYHRLMDGGKAILEHFKVERD